MSEFSQKISSIQTDLNALIRSVGQVESKVASATQEFQLMAEQADDIQTLTTAVTRLGRLLNSDKSPLLDKLRTQVNLIATELGKLNDKEIQKVTKSFEAQAGALNKLQAATSRIGSNLERTSQGLASLSTALESVKSSGAEATLDQVSKALQGINNLTNIKTVVSSLNNIKGDKITSAITSLQQLRDVMQDIERLGSIRVDVQDTPIKRQRRKQTNEQAESVANDVANSVQNLPSNVPTSRADAVQGTASKLTTRARGIEKINHAISAIEKAQVAVLEELLKDAGQSDKFETAKLALISRLSATEHREAFSQFQQDVPDAGYLEKLYKSRLGKQNVSTGLPASEGLDEINLGDQKLIQALYTLRRKAELDAQALKDATDPGNAQASVLTDIQSFSANVYRPISYGVTEFGAFMNGIMSVLRGVKVGGISGVIDALGGAFKSLHALNNAGAYFGTPLLPGGIGKIFNKKRSDTLLDVAEVGLGIQAGPRGYDERRVRELRYEERIQARSQRRLKSAIDDEALSPEGKAALQTELDAVNAELKKLRASIRAYNEVFKDQAELEGERAPLSSTGKDLAQASALGSTGATAQQSYDRAMNFAQSKIAQILSSAKYLNPSDFRQAYAAVKTNSGETNADRVGGFHSNERGIFVNAGYDANTQRGVAYHEATHAVLKDANRYDGETGIGFRDTELESLRLRAQAGYRNVTPQKSGDIFSDAAQQTAKLNPQYAYQATEMYANVSQSLLTGNKKLEATLRDIYGNKLFDKIVADLKTIDPAAYANIKEGAARVQGPIQQATGNIYERLLANLRSAFGPLYDTIYKNVAAFIQKIKEYAGGGQQLAGAQALQFITGPEDRLTGTRRTSQIPDTQGDLLTQLVTRYEGEINAAIGAVAGVAKLSGTGGDLGVSGLTGLLTKENLGKGLGIAGQITGINTQPLAGLLNLGGAGGQIVDQIVKALVSPATADFKSLGASLKSVNISRVLETYIKEQFNLKAYTGKEFLDRAKNLDAPFIGLATRPLAGKIVGDIANSFNADDPNVDPRSARRGQFFRKIAFRSLVDQFATRDVSFEDELNEDIRGRTGRNIRKGSYSQQAQFDPTTGLTKFVVSAQTADGAMVSLNAHVDEFGRKKIQDPTDIDAIGKRFSRFISDVPNQLIQQVTYSVVNGVQQMISNLVSVQDELAEVANLYQVVGDKAATVKESFLAGSVNTAVATGQGFQEAITTNLKNFKLLGAVKDPNQREDLSNQLSTIQLGAQTAFGVSLEQSLESIPAILSDITAKLSDVNDPVQRTTQAIAELQDVMDQIIVAQRATGASGDELLTVYSRLAASAREYGLSSKDLIALTATGSVSIGKGEAETSNILRSFLEGTYSQANESQLLKDFGIATRVTDKSTGQIKNRDFTDVLSDIVKFTQNPETEGRTAQLLQVFAGPKPAGDIGKFVRGYASDYQRTRQGLDDPGAQGAFGELVGQKIQNYQGGINKLNAAGTELFSSFLVGAGVIDKLTNFLNKMADAAGKLSGFIKDNKGAFQLFVNVLTPNLIDKMTSGLLGTVNVFTPFVKVLGAGQTAVRSLFAQLFGFDKVTRPVDKVNLTLRGLIQAIEALEKSTGRATGGVVGNLNRIAQAATGAQASVLGGVEAEVAGATKGPTNPNRRLLRRARGIVEDVEQIYNNDTPQVSGQARLPQRLAKTLGTVGDAIGAQVAPLGFDLLAGGLRTDNVVQNAGAAIGGAFVGAVTANPALGVFFYSIIGEVFERIDIGKYFHLSDKEADAFASALARRLRKETNTQTEDDKTVQSEEDRAKARQLQVARIARERGGDLLSAFGIDKLQGLNTKSGFGAYFGTSNKDVFGDSGDLERYRRLIVEGKKPESLRDEIFASTNPLIGNPTLDKTKNLYDALGTNELRDLYIKSNVSSPDKFIDAFKELAKGKGDLIGRKDIQDALIAYDARAQEKESGINTSQGKGDVTTITQSSEDIIKTINERLEAVTTGIQNQRSTPYGLAEYSPFGGKYAALQASFQPKIDASLRDTSKEGRERTQQLIEEFERGKQALDSLPGSLQVLIPLAQELGLATDGLEQKLYNVGPSGQQQLVQRFQPALDASAFNKQYDQRQKNLQFLQGTDQYRAKDPAIVKEAEALQKALGADKARYAINQAYLSTLKEQTNVLLDQAGALEKQQATRKLISAGTPGTPAQFTPASIFDTKGTTATELNNAIDFALKKQNKLAALNPEYRKEFAKDQFLFQSGTDFKGVTGVNQGFVQEFLAQKKQQSQAPLEDLSKLSDQELQATLERARGLQGQAEKLDPSRAGKYDNERILILRKNNELLAQTGIGQEFLKAALDQNTKANDQLRGHFNLPSNYKAPTVFDYYDSGGKEKGDKNFPTLASQGLVPLSFAQQLAQQLINPDNGERGADLSAITGTNQAGARPLFYPTPGTPGTAAVYEEVPPQLIPDTIKSDMSVSAAMQKFMDFKDRQAQDLLDAATIVPRKTEPYASDLGANKLLNQEPYASDLGANRIGKTNTPTYNSGDYTSGGDIGKQPLGPLAVPVQKDAIGLQAPRLELGKFTNYDALASATSGRSRDTYTSERGGGYTAPKNAAEVDAELGKLKNNTGGLTTQFNATTTATTGLVSSLKNAADVGKSLQSSASSIGTLNSGATAFASTVTNLQQKVAQLDLSNLVKNAVFNMIVNINGQQASGVQAQILTNSSAQGTNALAAGAGTKSGATRSTLR